MPRGSSRPTTPSPRRGCGDAALAALRHPDAAVRTRAERQSPNGIVGDQQRIDRVFSSLETERGGRELLRDYGLSFDHPHHIPRGFEGRRRNVTVTLCGDRRGRTPMHTVAVGGRDPEVARAPRGLGLSVRPAEGGLAELALRVVLQGLRRRDGDRRADPRGRRHACATVAARSRALGPATHSRSSPRSRCGRGMVMFTEDGGYDVVESVERDPARPAGLRPQRRAHAQLRRRRPRHAQHGVRLPRRRHQEYPQFPGRFRRRPRRQARAELPLDADHPLRRQRGRREQPGADGEGAVDGDRGGGPDQGPGALRRACGGSVRRGRDRADGRRGRLARGDRGLLPDQRAVAGARGHAGAGADRLPGHRRDEVLRAGGDPGRGRVPDVHGQPAGRRRVHARGQLAASAASARPRSRACSRTRTRWACRCGTRRRSPRACPGSGRRRARRSGASCRRWCGCASGPRATRRSGDLLDELLRETGYYDALEAERTIEAQGRLENLEELVRVAREYDALAEQGSRRGVPAADRADRRRRLAARRRGPRDADDAAQRQGPRVPDRVHDRDGGRRLPALARARRGRPGGGAAARLRRAHPRDARPHAHLRPPPQRLRRRERAEPAVALHRRGAARADRPGGQEGGRRRLGARPRRLVVQRRGGHRRRRSPTPPAPSSGSATTSSTPRSARAWSPPPSRAGSSSCASPATARSAS